VRIYNRALSAAEVSAIYNGGLACAGFGACAIAAQMDYDATNGMLWCDGTDFRAMKAP